jgi:hypothetical protein
VGAWCIQRTERISPAPDSVIDDHPRHASPAGGQPPAAAPPENGRTPTVRVAAPSLRGLVVDVLLLAAVAVIGYTGAPSLVKRV